MSGLKLSKNKHFGAMCGTAGLAMLHCSNAQLRKFSFGPRLTLLTVAPFSQLKQILDRQVSRSEGLERMR